MNPPNINAENLPLEPGYRWVDIANEPFTKKAEFWFQDHWSKDFDQESSTYVSGWSYRIKVEEPKPAPEENMLFPGAMVSKTGGDYRFDGTVIGVFRKLSGVVRYAVEDDRGVVHIYSRKNLIPRG